MSKQENKSSSFDFQKALFSLSSDSAVNISLWSLLSLPFKLFFRNWQSFLLLSIPFAAALTASSILFEHSILCAMKQETLITSSFCSDNLIYFYSDLIVRFLILMFFVIKWYKIALLKIKTTLKSFFALSKYDTKAIVLMTLFMLINILPLFALILLIIREPNPNWLLELGYFTSVAWLFLVPLIALRFYSLLAFALEQKKLPTFKEVWSKTSGNNLKILLSAGTIVFIALFVFMQYYATMMQLTSITTFDLIIAEFEYNILITMFAILYVNFCYAQKLELFKGETNE